MLWKSLLPVGALAATANAVLLPMNHDGTVDLSVRPSDWNVVLDCTTCPYAVKSDQNDDREWKKDVPSDLDMKFGVDQNSLTFNGVPIYPITTPGLPPALTVSQKAKDSTATSEGGDVSDLRVSYSLEMIQKPFNDGNTLLTLTMTIMALENEMIRIDDVEIKAVRDSEGNLMLLSALPAAASPDAPDAQCKNVLCRVFTKFLTSLAKAKASATAAAHKVKHVCVKCFRCILHLAHKGHRHHHHHANHGTGAPHRHPDGTMELPSHVKTPSDHLHGEHPHPHHPQWLKKGFFGRMGHVMWVAIKIAFVPILIGFAFGILASAIGMLIGQAIVFLWMRYRRNDDRCSYEPLAKDIKEEVPPPYEDVPTIQSQAMDEKEVEAKA